MPVPKQPTNENTDLDRQKSFATRGLVAFFVFLALAIGVFVFRPVIRTIRYQPVTGTITRSEMEYCGVEVGAYGEQIRFSYTVAGKKHSNGRLRLDVGEMCESKDKIALILGAYPVGREVQSWYDPDHPEVCVIDRSPGPIQWFYLGVMGGFLLIFLFARWRQQIIRFVDNVSNSNDNNARHQSQIN